MLANTVCDVAPPQIPGTRVRERRGGESWEFRVDRLADLGTVAVASIGAGSLTAIDVSVGRWSPPAAGWLGHPRIPGLTELQVVPRGSGVQVQIRVAEPLDAALLMAGCLRCLSPQARDRGPSITFSPGLPDSAGMLAGSMQDVVVEGEQRDPHVRRSDVLLVPAVGDSATHPAEDGAAGDGSTTVRIGATTWERDGQSFEVCVDPKVHRPLGRRTLGPWEVATATISGGVATLATAEGRLVLGRSVTAASTRALRSIGAVISDELPDVMIRQLNACGVLVRSSVDGLPQAEDHLAWLELSVAARRHALRQYGPAAALDAWPCVSVVLVTHRATFIEHAMQQLARLSYPRLDIVIGAHGGAVDADEIRRRAAELPHPTTVLSLDGGLTLGEALQRASDRAEGDLITKMDDDDFYGAEHVWDLVLARQYSGAEIVGKALDWVHLAQPDVTVLRPTYPAEKYADFVAGGTILISRGDLASVGGWRPVPRSVDRALLDRVLADGGLVYRTHGLGYMYVRRPEGHTASVRDEHFLTKVAVTYPGLLHHPEFGTAT